MPRKIFIMCHCTIIKQHMHVGHHIMTSQYPVNLFTYGGIFSTIVALTTQTLFLACVKFCHATSHMVLANQKQGIL